MKLTKKEKQKLIGKKIVVDRILKKKYKEEWIASNILTGSKFGEGEIIHGNQYMIREIETITLSNSIKAVIVGFTHLCQGKFSFDDSGVVFICNKRIPCIKIASGLTGKILYAPIRFRPSTLLSVCGRRIKK